jgi:hypothetical protein
VIIVGTLKVPRTRSGQPKQSETNPIPPLYDLLIFWSSSSPPNLGSLVTGLLLRNYTGHPTKWRCWFSATSERANLSVLSLTAPWLELPLFISLQRLMASAAREGARSRRAEHRDVLDQRHQHMIVLITGRARGRRIRDRGGEPAAAVNKPMLRVPSPSVTPRGTILKLSAGASRESDAWNDPDDRGNMKTVHRFRVGRAW